MGQVNRALEPGGKVIQNPRRGLVGKEALVVTDRSRRHILIFSMKISDTLL